ncbi:hypothetical protein BC832DRAFT_540326 [Gaertneriomyces semiglobifer]|nr:hypothetical protein BC832DRAFT_540326 [Gaertneriomyces semiglobifer]
MSGLNSRTATGLRLLTNTNIISGFVSGDGLQAIGEDVELKDFQRAHIEEISNKNGPMLINNIDAEAPLSSTIEDGVASVSLMYNEEDFQVDNQSGIALRRSVAAEFPLTVEREDTYDVIDLKYGAPFGISEDGLSLVTDSSLTLDGEGKLTVVREEKETYEVPIVKDTDNVVKLSIDSPFVVKDGKLGVEQKEMSKGIGAISVYSAMDKIIPGMGDFIDIPDLPGDMEEYIGNAILVKLNVSDDFQQTGNRLAIRSKGMHEIPYYGGLSGFNSSNRFSYNETLSTLTAPTFHAEAVDYNIIESRQLPTCGYVHQLYQSQAGSGIDVGVVTNGRKLIKINHDTTLNINEANQLEVNVANIADGTSVKAVNGKLSVDLTAGDGISVTDNTIATTLTFEGSLWRTGDVVSGRTVLSGSTNVTVSTSNPYAYTIAVTDPQPAIDNLQDEVTDLNDKVDQNKIDLDAEDDRLENKIDAVESPDVTGLTGVVDTVNTVATGVQVAQAVMKGDLTSVQGILTSVAGEVTGLSSTVAAIQAMPVVRGVIGIGVLAAQDPVTGVVTITASSPLMAKSKGTAPVDPILKSDDSILKDNGGGTDIGETAPPVDPPILPPNPPPPPPGGDTLRSTGRTDGNNGPCLDPIPPIWKGKDHTNQESWFREGWGVVWSRLPTIEVDGVPRTVLEYDENNLPIVPHGHIDIIHRRTDEDDFSSVLLTHDRHLQSGYLGVYHESMLQVPNLAMLYETWDSFMRPDLQSLTTKSYVDGLSYLTAGTGITKTGSVVAISNATAAINTTTGALRVTGGAGIGGNIFAGGTVTAATPTAAGHLTTKGYVDALSYLSVGAGLVKTGNTISLGSDLSAFEVKSNLKVLAYKDKVDYATDVINAPASVTYGSGLLFSNNTVSLNPAVSVDSVTTTGNISFAGSFNGTMNVNGSNSRTTLQIRAGGGTGLYINVNAQARTAFGGGNTATLMTYNGALRVLSQREKGIVIDEHGSIDVSERLSVGTTSDVVAFPPLSMTSNSTIISNQAYGNGTYVASTSSIFSSTYQPYAVFAAGGGWYSEATSGYDVTTGLYAGSQTTIVNSTNIAGEWVQIQMPVGIFLTSFDISGSSTYIRNVRDFALVGSNDGSTFIHVLSSTISSWINGQMQTVNVQTPTTTKPFKIYRLIIRSVSGLNSAYCYVGRLVFNGTPVSMDIRGTISANQVVTENLVCSGGVQMNGLTLQDDVLSIATFPDIPMTGALTGQYTTSSSSVYSGTWTAWKIYNPYVSDNNNTWFSANDTYSTNGSYIGTASTTVDGSAVSGEWVQLGMQTSIALTSVYIASPTAASSQYFDIKDFVLAASNDNSTWKQVTSGTFNWSSSTTNGLLRELNIVITTNPPAYQSYRLIAKSIIGDSTGAKYAQIYALKFKGGPLKKVLSVDNQKVRNLAFKDTIDWNTNDIINKPSTFGATPIGVFQYTGVNWLTASRTDGYLSFDYLPNISTNGITCTTTETSYGYRISFLTLPSVGVYSVEIVLSWMYPLNTQVNAYEWLCQARNVIRNSEAEYMPEGTVMSKSNIITYPESATQYASGRFQTLRFNMCAHIQSLTNWMNTLSFIIWHVPTTVEHRTDAFKINDIGSASQESLRVRPGWVGTDALREKVPQWEFEVCLHNLPSFLKVFMIHETTSFIQNHVKDFQWKHLLHEIGEKTRDKKNLDAPAREHFQKVEKTYQFPLGNLTKFPIQISHRRLKSYCKDVWQLLVMVHKGSKGGSQCRDRKPGQHVHWGTVTKLSSRGYTGSAFA